MPIETWINIIQGLITIGASAYGSVMYFRNKAALKHEKWVERFLRIDLKSEGEKEALLTKAYKEFKKEKKVKAIFLEACDLSGRYSEKSAEDHFNRLWDFVYTKVINFKEEGR